MIGERIKNRREELHLSQEELAKQMGYKSRSSINKMELGIQDVPQRKIKQFAKVLQCSIGYLLEDDKNEQPQVHKQHKRALPNIGAPLYNFISSLRNIPIHSALSCGTGSFVDEIPEDFIGIPEDMLSRHCDYFGNRADGDSMEPLITNGDILVFEMVPQVDSGKIGSFSLNGEYFCKRFKRMPDGSCWLFSENPKYDPIPILPEDEFRTLGLYKIKVSKEQ